MPEISVEEVTKAVKDAAYVAIGFGVLTVQRAQVQRRELTDQIQTQVTEARDNLDKVTADTTAQWEKLSGTIEDRVKLLDERITDLEDRLDDVLDDVEAKLPEQAADLVKQARGAAKDAREQVRSLVGIAA